MNDFDEALRAALHRQEAPSGFADRVLRRTSGRRRSPALWAAIGIAAGIAVIVGITPVIQHQRQERAVRQTRLALSITAEKLNLVRAQISRRGVTE